jgi:hypothetical protein
MKRRRTIDSGSYKNKRLSGAGGGRRCRTGAVWRGDKLAVAVLGRTSPWRTRTEVANAADVINDKPENAAL